MPKTDNPLLLTLYAHIVDGVLDATGNIEEANQRLREIGTEIGSQIYLNTEISEKTKDTVTTREDVAKLVDAIYKIMHDKRPTDVDMDSSRGSIRVSDKTCVWCQDVSLEGMRGFGYCEIFSGILQSILEFKGVESKVFQETCKATGAETCIWNVRLV